MESKEINILVLMVTCLEKNVIAIHNHKVPR